MLRKALLITSLPLGAIVLFAGMSAADWNRALPLLFLGVLGICLFGILVHGFRLSAMKRQRLLEKLASPDFTMISGPPPKVMLVAAFILAPMVIALVALAMRLFANGDTHGFVYGSVTLLAGLGFQAGVQRRVSDYLLWRHAWKEARAQRRTGHTPGGALNWERRRGQGVL